MCNVHVGVFTYNIQSSTCTYIYNVPLGGCFMLTCSFICYIIEVNDLLYALSVPIELLIWFSKRLRDSMNVKYDFMCTCF